MEDDTITVAEAARVFGINERQLRRLIAKGTIPARRSEGVWLTSREAVQAHIEGRQVAA